jgi:hypothetical protein
MSREHPWSRSCDKTANPIQILRVEPAFGERQVENEYLIRSFLTASPSGMSARLRRSFVFSCCFFSQTQPRHRRKSPFAFVFAHLTEHIFLEWMCLPSSVTLNPWMR